MSAPCAQFDWEMVQLANTDDVMNFQDSYYDLLPYVANHSGIEFSYNKPLDVAYKLSVLYGILFVEVPNSIIVQIQLFCFKQQ